MVSMTMTRPAKGGGGGGVERLTFLTLIQRRDVDALELAEGLLGSHPFGRHLASQELLLADASLLVIVPVFPRPPGFVTDLVDEPHRCFVVGQHVLNTVRFVTTVVIGVKTSSHSRPGLVAAMVGRWRTICRGRRCRRLGVGGGHGGRSSGPGQLTCSGETVVWRCKSMPGLPGGAVEDVVRVGWRGIGAGFDRCRRLGSHGWDGDRGVKGSGQGRQARSAQVGRRLVGSVNTSGGSVPPLLGLLWVVVLIDVLVELLGLALQLVGVVAEAVVQLVEVRSQSNLGPVLPRHARGEMERTRATKPRRIIRVALLVLPVCCCHPPRLG